MKGLVCGRENICVMDTKTWCNFWNRIEFNSKKVHAWFKFASRWTWLCVWFGLVCTLFVCLWNPKFQTPRAPTGLRWNAEKSVCKFRFWECATSPHLTFLLFNLYNLSTTTFYTISYYTKRKKVLLFLHVKALVWLS